MYSGASVNDAHIVLKKKLVIFTIEFSELKIKFTVIRISFINAHY